VTCSIADRQNLEEFGVKTIIFEGSKMIAASLASTLHPQHKNIKKKSIHNRNVG